MNTQWKKLEVNNLPAVDDAVLLANYSEVGTYFMVGREVRRQFLAHIADEEHYPYTHFMLRPTVPVPEIPELPVSTVADLIPAERRAEIEEELIAEDRPFPRYFAHTENGFDQGVVVIRIYNDEYDRILVGGAYEHNSLSAIKTAVKFVNGGSWRELTEDAAMQLIYPVETFGEFVIHKRGFGCSGKWLQFNRALQRGRMIEEDGERLEWFDFDSSSFDLFTTDSYSWIKVPASDVIPMREVGSLYALKPLSQLYAIEPVRPVEEREYNCDCL